MCLCASSEYREREKHLKKYAEGKVWVIYAVSQHSYNTKAIDLQCNWGQTLRSFYFPPMVIRALYHGRKAQ